MHYPPPLTTKDKIAAGKARIRERREAKEKVVSKILGKPRKK